MKGTTNIDSTRGGQIIYDNTSSGLSATNVQEAIDEVQGEVSSQNLIFTNDYLQSGTSVTHTLEPMCLYMVSAARAVASSCYLAITSSEAILNTLVANASIPVSIDGRDITVQNNTSNAVRLNIIRIGRSN